MSLVAYAASSDEDEEDNIIANGKDLGKTSLVATTNGKVTSDYISDDDDDYAPTEFTALPTTTNVETNNKLPLHGLSLPKPKNVAYVIDPDNDLEEVTPAFSQLPLPKRIVEKNTVIEEEDDEFLHKKATLPAEEMKPTLRTAVVLNKGPVKIAIPSLKDFKDVEKDIGGKAKNKPLTGEQKKSSLLSMLPQAKSEQNFSKTATNKQNNANAGVSEEHAKPPVNANRFIPDTVKSRRPAHNTEGVDVIKKSTKKPNALTNSKPKLSLVACSDSDGSDNDEGQGDFFSLNTEDKLPEVSINEINAMIAQRAARMANATTQYLQTAADKNEEIEETNEMENKRLLAEQQQEQYRVLDQKAMHALAGSSAKRRRKEENIQVVDISSSEVLPSRDEWMRTALASSTAYQPTGVLVDEEPAAGTRRKHQITYLAHKAKANEAELQAMWSVNRQNRRATQSKYGF
ncbi:proline-rich protein PRCC [Eurosta solidaginis]|uniref:proline-rich protein PRCC n=1 Tax=Eurosta solidaginis TaxID=178769 RepID=UPI00353117F4